jgi:DNA polymerase-3 subunit epsilon
VDYRHRVVEVDQPWRQAGYCVVDLETTGLDPRRDDIVSVGAVPVVDGRVVVGRAIYRLVGNPRQLRDASVVVHGLRPADLAGAPPWEETVDELLVALTGSVLVAHAAWIETGFLERGLRRRRVRAPRYVVDTAALARATGVVPSGLPGEPALEALARRLGLPAHEPHNALGDAMMTAEVFLALTARLEGEASLTAWDLVQTSDRHRWAGPRALGAARR